MIRFGSVFFWLLLSFETFSQDITPSADLSEVGAFLPRMTDSGVHLQQENPVIRSPLPDRGPRVGQVIRHNLFSGAPMMPGTRGLMAQGEAPTTYMVQPGDTLYDICDQLIDEPEYWPKLWALNPEIKNPHFVYPGMKIRFYPASDDSPPLLQIVVEDDLVPVDKEELKEDVLVAQDISDLVLKTTEPSRVAVVDESGVSIPSKTSLETFVKEPLVENKKLLLPAVVLEEKIDGEGWITGGETGGKLLRKGDGFLVTGEALGVGQTYSVLRYSSEVDSEAGFVGYRYEVVGAVRLVSQLEEETYTGSVTYNRIGVMSGDILVEYRSVRRTLPSGYSGVKSAPPRPNEVVGFEHPGQSIGGEKRLILFEKISGGLEVGDVVKIYSWGNPSQQQLIPRQAGLAVIIDSSSQVATGYIFTTTHAIHAGDFLGGQGASSESRL